MWHYHLNDISNGPVNDEAIVDLIFRRLINRDTLVWKEGMPQWKPLAATELLKFLPVESPCSQPPPLPMVQTHAPAWPLNILLFGCVLNVIELITDILFADHYAGTHFGITSTSEEIIVVSAIGLAFAIIALCFSIYMKVSKPSKGGFMFVCVLGALTLIPGGALSGILLIVMSVLGFKRVPA